MLERESKTKKKKKIIMNANGKINVTFDISFRILFFNFLHFPLLPQIKSFQVLFSNAFFSALEDGAEEIISQT